ncbi:DNA/RNA nuclease SfsA [Acidithiobacillus sp. IBUN Pt1247-S3]|uniref:DNA/RNA nuclease SfsA n=1 Tax=Acidithiobacillus sp. IBUN Pt1247-S3 TaxID=3166642 RepID=UPI0034E4822D
MKLPTLTPAHLLRRYKRFLADCELESGEIVQAHCPNPGSMRSCADAGQPVLLSWTNDPKRKLPWTWELYWSGASWVTINTQRPNAVVAEALQEQRIAELAGYSELRREVAYGEHERVDFWLNDPQLGQAFVEVKSCTLLDDDAVLRFPDARSSRALRHLAALAEERKRGHRAVMLFLLGREDGCGFAPADAVDPEYGRALRRARDLGIEVLAYRSRVRPDSIEISDAEPLLF